MTRLSLQVENGVTNFAPGAQVVATAEWELERPATSIDFRLRWFTLGKGDSDGDVVQEVTFDDPGTVGQKRFGIQLPDSPYSFSGKLISLVWVLEIEAVPSGETAQVEIVIAPDAQEIVLVQTKEEDQSSSSLFDDDRGEQ